MTSADGGSAEQEPTKASGFEATGKNADSALAVFVEAAPNAMVMINRQGVIRMVNAEAERVFGYRRSEMVGQSMELLVPERFRAAHPDLRIAFCAFPTSRPMGAGRDLFALRKDGSEFPVEIGLNPIETEEGAMVLSAVVDISDRKQKEESIRRALREKETLLLEIHHRVKNNLQIIYSLLGLQSTNVTDPTARQALFDCQQRVRAMALIHNALYKTHDMSRVEFQPFISELSVHLMHSYGGTDRIRLSIEAAGVALPISAAIPCGVLVNEVMSNAFKHAFPDNLQGEIFVSLQVDPQLQATLIVQDDGVGLPKDIDLENSSSIGLQLVQLLSEQLCGTLSINPFHPTRFQVIFPVPDLEQGKPP